MKYFVDFGHGGNDSGAIGGNVYEKNINKLIGERVVYHLQRHSQTVVLTRPNDETVSLDERVNIINKNGCDLGISIHCNSFSDTSAQGIETYTWGPGAREKDLANKVHTEILRTKLYSKNRGLKESNFRILSPQIPCVLVECGFISNDQDRKMLLDNIEGFAVAITKGLLSYYAITYKLYRVQVGAYANKTSADNMLKLLKSKGFDGYITQ